MKPFLLLLLTSVFVPSFGQIDTIRWYYQNGNLASVQPFQGGQKTGETIQYYVSGELKSNSQYKPKIDRTITTTFYKSGAIEAQCFLDSFTTTSSKTYFENGNLKQYRKLLENGTYLKKGYNNGKIKKTETIKYGNPVSCIAYQQKDSTLGEKFCYCGAKRVYWKDDQWADQTGNAINGDFNYRLTEYDSMGTKTLLVKQHGCQKKIKTRINNQWETTRIVDTMDVIIIPYYESNSVSNSVLEKYMPAGYPLLREPSPPRDTLIRKYILKELTDSTIHWDVLTRTYDSLGQVISIYSNYGEIKIHGEERTSNGYVSYGDSKTNISFHINSANPIKAKVCSTSEYSFYATDKEVDVVWKE